MNTSNFSSTIANNTSYTSIQKTVKGNTYSIMVVRGKFNYVNVRKVTNNPFGTLGNEFPSWEAAASNYKSGEMKTMLVFAEIEFNEYFSTLN